MLHSITARLLAVLLTASLLSACGFTLRGSDSGQLLIDRLQLQSPVGSELALHLQRDLQRAGVTVLEADAERTDSHLLQLGPEEVEQRPLSVNTRARGAEYEVSLSVPATLLRDGDILEGPEVLTVRQQHDQDPANISASDREMELLLSELRQQLSQQLLRRLQTLAPVTVETEPEPEP